MRGWPAIVLLCAACGPGGPPAQPPATTEPTRQPERGAAGGGERSASPPALPRCGAPSVPSATAYDALTQPGNRFSLVVRREGDEWIPAQQLSMPLHHASRIEFTNLDAVDLPTAAEAMLRLTFVTLGRENLGRRGERMVLFEYSVRVENACLADAPPDRRSPGDRNVANR